jgi:peptidoglycan/xylan/chitin deacetylase (PgdA/CDA1 family)
MFFDQDIKGDRLPPKTLCLTYDDGPGPKTLGLGRVLHRLGVRATFFAVGRHARRRPDVLLRLAAWGHLVGNHTHTHPGLAAFAAGGGDVASELARADAAIRAAAGGPVTFFRAPYGNWRETDGPGGPDRPRSPVAGAANRSPLARRYVGPVNWDVCAEDWEFWRRGDPAGACAAAYVAEAERVGRGIVLMHDSSADDPAARAGNRACEATALLVPALLERGFRFVRLDEVPQVRSAVRVTGQVTIDLGPGTPVVRDEGDWLVARPGGTPRVFGVVPVAGGAVALRAANGCLVSAGPAGGAVTAAAPDVGAAETFAREAAGRGRFVFRADAGGYLGVGPGGALAVVPRRRRTEFRLRRRFPVTPDGAG